MPSGYSKTLELSYTIFSGPAKATRLMFVTLFSIVSVVGVG
jgi:hypothetical protein